MQEAHQAAYIPAQHQKEVSDRCAQSPRQGAIGPTHDRIHHACLPEIHVFAVPKLATESDEVYRLESHPEVDVGVIEDVGVHVEVVEALRAQHHAHVVTAIK